VDTVLSEVDRCDPILKTRELQPLSSEASLSTFHHDNLRSSNKSAIPRNPTDSIVSSRHDIAASQSPDYRAHLCLFHSMAPQRKPAHGLEIYSTAHDVPFFPTSVRRLTFTDDLNACFNSTAFGCYSRRTLVIARHKRWPWTRLTLIDSYITKQRHPCTADPTKRTTTTHRSLVATAISWFAGKPSGTKSALEFQRTTKDFLCPTLHDICFRIFVGI
jgi:hypothetical protein